MRVGEEMTLNSLPTILHKKSIPGVLQLSGERQNNELSRKLSSFSSFVSFYFVVEDLRVIPLYVICFLVCKMQMIRLPVKCMAQSLPHGNCFNSTELSILNSRIKLINSKEATKLFLKKSLWDSSCLCALNL